MVPSNFKQNVKENANLPTKKQQTKDKREGEDILQKER
jgi:hypothetical protein